MLTQNYLQSILDYRDGFLYWKVKTTSKSRVNIKSRAGCLSKYKTGHRYIVGINGKHYYSSRLIYFYHTGEWPKNVDHINHITSDDRIENLRGASHDENMRNRTSHKNSSSQYLGVSWCKALQKWSASIRVKGKDIFLGYHDLEINAAKAYNSSALIHHKEFANLNKIETKKKTMINITIEGESAFDVRRQIQELLGLIPSQEISNKEEMPIGVEKTAENFEAPKMEVEKPAEETAAPGKKRRTKAEIEAEGLKKLNAALDPADPEVKDTIQSDNDVAETDNKETTTVTAVMLQEKAVSLIRNNKKSEVVAIIKKFGGDSISQADKNPLKVEVYADVMDELNKIA